MFVIGVFLGNETSLVLHIYLCPSCAAYLGLFARLCAYDGELMKNAIVFLFWLSLRAEKGSGFAMRELFFRFWF